MIPKRARFRVLARCRMETAVIVYPEEMNIVESTRTRNLLPADTAGDSGGMSVPELKLFKPCD